VIDLVDEAVRTLLKRDALDGTDVEVVFDAPNREWAARQNSPAVNVYLYDIREDMKWRAYGVTDVRENGLVAGRHPPRRHFKFSYLVTAWTQRPEDEHRLLSAVLACFLRFDLIPQEVLSGVLEGVKPVSVTIGTPPPDDRSVSDVWTALGGELKPSLDLAISVPLDPDRMVTEIAPPVLEEPRFSFDAAGIKEHAVSRRGPRNRAALPKPVVVEEYDGGIERQRGRRLRISNSPVPPSPSDAEE
jgi:hypothetical protein